MNTNTKQSNVFPSVKFDTKPSLWYIISGKRRKMPNERGDLDIRQQFLKCLNLRKNKFFLLLSNGPHLVEFFHPLSVSI